MKEIKSHNQFVPIDHKKKITEIKKNKDIIDFID